MRKKWVEMDPQAFGQLAMDDDQDQSNIVSLDKGQYKRLQNITPH